MPRYPRSYVKTEYFHVITQGINKSYIFEDKIDIKKYIKIMYDIRKDNKIEIIAYCIMNNHAHMLLKSDTINNLSRYMRLLNGMYAMYYNKKYDRVGYVFRDRYKSEGIYSQKHLYNCISYIYNNPVKANICDKPEDYPYSNYNKNRPINCIDEEYQFIEVDENKEEKCRKIINDFLTENEIEIDTLKKDKYSLRKLLILLRNECKISWRKLEKELEMSRETMRNICK